MYRTRLVLSIGLILLAGRADAIEMFTNFNNGQNVGFPPIEVPISVYRGFGRGGWNPYAEGMPLKTAPPVPAMMPTGQVPHVWAPANTSNMSRANQSQAGNVAAAFPQRVASDRRRSRWQRGAYRPAPENGGDNQLNSSNSADSLNPPRPDVDDDSPGAGPSPNGRRSPTQPNQPIVLERTPGAAPNVENSPEAANRVAPVDDSTQIRGTDESADFWPSAAALFPKDAG